MNFQFNVDTSFHLSAILITTLNYLIYGILFYRLYKKRDPKPIWWKALIVSFIGQFIFSINFNFFDSIIQLPILPLGVWILYWILKSKNRAERWGKYRPFAWLGFWLRFLYMFTSLLIHPLDHLMFPKDELHTFLSDSKGAKIIKTTSTAKNVNVNRSILAKSISSFKLDKIYSEIWYHEMYEDNGKAKKERFPYLLIGTKPKWGSNLNEMIYVEKDGKGLLVITKEKQYYFRTDHRFISSVTGGTNNEE